MAQREPLGKELRSSAIIPLLMGNASKTVQNSWQHALHPYLASQGYALLQGSTCLRILTLLHQGESEIVEARGDTACVPDLAFQRKRLSMVCLPRREVSSL